MQESGFRRWLERTYELGVARGRFANVRRVERCYGDLDGSYDQDRLQNLINSLNYSADDERRKKPNPTKIPIDGVLSTNLAMYRGALALYQAFRDESGPATIKEAFTETTPDLGAAADCDVEVAQRIGLERDLQKALRLDIEQLEPGLIIIDDGCERFVPSGRIDMTARDSSGKTVVIELKAGTVGKQAIGQILSYMGDVANEEQSDVRGILVGASFDAGTKAAARVVPGLILRSYSVKFSFVDGHANLPPKRASA